VEARVAAWRTEITRPAAERGDAGALEASCRTAGRALREAVWDPVAPAAAGAALVLLVPDGAIHLVSFAALPVDRDRYLSVSAPPLQVLSTERDVVSFGAPPSRSGGLLALGGPDFDTRPSDEGPEVGGAFAEPTWFRGPLADCPDLASHRFAPLPGAVPEAEEVAAAWSRAVASPAVLAVAERATETLFKREAPGTRVLHIATHGFFLGDGCLVAGPDLRGVAAMAPRPSPPGSGLNPLRLSGLALAGANRRDEAPPGEDDGILTAEEIGALDLAGVEWAVLSACESGVGDVRAGEGVFGLRRAFRAAGARTLILSLWSVEDAAAREWMRALYEARLALGQGTAWAVQTACRKVLERRLAAGESTHPFYWAPFVAAGDWR
jgi:CHAT domain-containing protein